MAKQNVCKSPVPVSIITVNEFGECDKWYNLKDTITYDVVCLWGKRGMTEQMYDYFIRVVEAGHKVDVLIPTHAIKYNLSTKKDVDDMCDLFEMLFA